MTMKKVIPGSMIKRAIAQMTIKMAIACMTINTPISPTTMKAAIVSAMVKTQIAHNDKVAASKARVLLCCRTVMRSDKKLISSASKTVTITIVWHKTGTEVTLVAIYQEFVYKCSHFEY